MLKLSTDSDAKSKDELADADDDDELDTVDDDDDDDTDDFEAVSFFRPLLDEFELPRSRSSLRSIDSS